MQTNNTTYLIADDIDGIIASLENPLKTLFNWFSHNIFKGNADKCHLLFNNVKDEISMKTDDFGIVNSECEKLLGFKFDLKLTFHSHI